MAEEAEHADEFRLILEIADALQTELGTLMEEQPAFRDPDDAGQLNRAFRIVARCILRTVMPLGVAPAERMTSVFLQAARQRLEGGGLDGQQIQHLLDMEPAGRDDWLAFLILTGWDEILLLLDPDAAESD